QCGHGVVNSCLMQAHSIHIAFDDEEALQVGTCLAGLIQSVELASLVEECRLGRVEVFGFALVNDSTSKCNNPPAHIPDREHDTVPKAVVVVLAFADRAALALDDQTQLRQRPALCLARAE